MLNPPTLAEMRHSLADGGGGASSSTEPKSKKSRGSGDFDESKVKRDGSGQFSKQSKDFFKEQAELEAYKLDLEWQAKGDELYAKASKKFEKQAAVIFDETARKHGFANGDDLRKNMKGSADSEKFLRDYTSATVKAFNSSTKSDPSLLSPSGNSRLELYVTPDGPRHRFTATPKAQKAAEKIRAKSYATTKKHLAVSPKISESDDKPLFNPSATIDKTRVKDYVPVKHGAIETTSPTLSEMQHALQIPPPESVVEPPTLSQMTHILETEDDVLEHFGIKGMKWGIRRSAKQLATVRDGDGEETGKLYGTARAKAELAKLRPGQVKVIDTEDGPKITIKQKDGSLREVRLSADQEGVLRTMRKDPSEMSTRELKEATARAKALDDYNKLFNPTEDVNKALQDKVNAMKLQSDYATMYAKANPSATKRIINFVNEVKGPTFSAWAVANKATNGALNKNISDMLKSMNAPAPSGQNASKGTRASQPKVRKTKTKGSRKSNEHVYDITSMGKDDYPNPFIPQLESRRG